LNVDEFLNIDAIFESVLTKMLLLRIKRQLYRLMILETTRNGELPKLSENLVLIRGMALNDLGFPGCMSIPDSNTVFKS